jgi:hypothetical protein
VGKGRRFFQITAGREASIPTINNRHALSEATMNKKRKKKTSIEKGMQRYFQSDFICITFA